MATGEDTLPGDQAKPAAAPTQHRPVEATAKETAKRNAASMAYSNEKLRRRVKTPVPQQGDANIERMVAIGYLGGVTPAPEADGVVAHDTEKAYQGLNLYVSGHAPEAILMDMAGNVLHKWGISYVDVWPEYRLHPGMKPPNFWRRAHLYPNGDLLGIYGGTGMVKVDKDSKRLWGFRENAHHDLDVTPDGTIYVLTHGWVKNKELDPKSRQLVDSIVVLNGDGKVLKRVPILACFVNSPYVAELQAMKKRGDVMHTNTIEVLDGRHVKRMPAFKKGNVLISIRETNTIAVIDLKRRRVVWALSTLWHGQHQPTLGENGRMLIFDNRGLGGRSRILDFNPRTQQIEWTYGRRTDEFFFSYYLGSVQALPNNNILITESNNGRAFEVTRGREIVWDFVSPQRAWDHPEMVANLYELIRLPADFPIDWADPATAALEVKVIPRSTFKKRPSSTARIPGPKPTAEPQTAP